MLDEIASQYADRRRILLSDALPQDIYRRTDDPDIIWFRDNTVGYPINAKVGNNGPWKLTYLAHIFGSMALPEGIFIDDSQLRFIITGGMGSGIELRVREQGNERKFTHRRDYKGVNEILALIEFLTEHE